MSAMLSFASFSASSFAFDIVSLLVFLCYIFLKNILLSLIYFIIYLSPGNSTDFGIKAKIVLDFTYAVFLYCEYAVSALQIPSVSPLSEELSLAYDFLTSEEHLLDTAFKLHTVVAGVI